MSVNVTIEKSAINVTKEAVETVVTVTAETSVITVSRESASGNHSTLTNLDSDDHAQYHTDARGDLRYLPLAHTTSFNHNNFVTAFGWGDHVGLYDPVGSVSTHEGSYNHANYDTAYSWGDHAGLYLPLVGGVLTGPLTLYNGTDALQSGDYTLQFNSGVANGASAVGYHFDTTNLLNNSTAKHITFSTGGSEFLNLKYGAGLGLYGGNMAVLDVSSLGPFGGILLNVGVVGSIVFSNTGTSVNKLCVNASGSTFASTSAGTNANPAQVAFGYNWGSSVSFSLQKYTSTHGLEPDATCTLGTNRAGDSANYKWLGLYLKDAGNIYFGNGVDASINYDGSNLVVDPQLVGTGGFVVKNMKSGATQAGAGAVVDELWKTAGHATLPDNVVLIGV